MSRYAFLTVPRARAETEAVEERLCDRLIETLGGDIVRLSQRRASHVAEGLPDRRYRLKGIAWWWEIKRPGGQLTTAQFDFLSAEFVAQEIVGAGTAQELGDFVLSFSEPGLHRPWVARERGWDLVRAVAARGFRDGKARP